MSDADAGPQRVIVAGDWHANTRWALAVITAAVPFLAAEDRKIILHCGDFGIWPGQRAFPDLVSRALADAGAELWFVDGNHEDFGQLADLEPGPDGREPVTGHIWHLPRGYRWHWHGRQWLALGGAVSPDRARRAEGWSWWPEEAVTEAQARSVISAGPADIMLTHDCPASVTHAFPPPPGWWDPADLARSDAHRERLQRVADGVRPRWVIHGHLHMGYRREVMMPHGPAEVTGLACDGEGDPWSRTRQANWAVLNVRDMRWE